MKNPVISILIPVYNVEKYLDKCLDSLISQTLTNIEIICVNDGSTDNSKQILESYQKKDSRVKVINKENGGLPSARNAGLDAAKGKYVGFVDSDDYVEINMFEKMVAAAEKDDSDIVVCGANIFPESEEISKWLRDCLSPRESYYEEFDSEILFRRIDVSTFLWRTIIRKSLIDEYHFRLDKDINLGEDKAFLCKVCPKAKGITIISDKLYNYYWCRPDSLMGSENYSDMSGKVLKHAKLTERIGRGIIDGEISPEDSTVQEFLEWSIPFIYNDFLYVPFNEKIEIAEKLIGFWIEAGYYKFEYALQDWIKNAFRYMQTFEGLNSIDSMLSIIIPVEYTSRYLDELFAHILNFEDAFEIIITNNGMPNEKYTILLEEMMLHHNIRLFNTPKHFTYARCLNVGTQLAVSPYICFLDPQDWFISAEKLLDWAQTAMENDADICTCNFSEKRTHSDFAVKKIEISDIKKDGCCLDFHDALYKASFILKEKLCFEEMSVMTGQLFWGKVVTAANIALHINESIYISRDYYQREWVSTENCEKVLDALDKLIDISLDSRNPYLHGMVYSILNGDVMNQIIVQNTKPYKTSPQQNPNGENSQIKTVETLLDILNKIDYQLLQECGFDDEECCGKTLSDVLDERQKFLNELK